MSHYDKNHYVQCRLLKNIAQQNKNDNNVICVLNLINFAAYYSKPENAFCENNLYNVEFADNNKDLEHKFKTIIEDPMGTLLNKINSDSIPTFTFTRAELETIKKYILLQIYRTPHNKKSFREIAKLLGRSPSTISREVRRNTTFVKDRYKYYPHTAQKKYMLRSSYRHRGVFWDSEVLEYINEKLLATWSPEQIANTPCELELPSFKTIYRWIYQKYLVRGNLKVLRRKGKTALGKETRGKLSNKGKSIRKRDKAVYKRLEFGHWEMDTVVSGLGKSKACFVTFAERKTRYYIAVKAESRNAETIANVVCKALSVYPKGTVKSITTDNGMEFAKWKEIERRLDTEIYFADAYCA